MRVSIAGRAASVLLIALVASAIAAARVHAAEGLFLTWGDCALGGAGNPNLSIPCESDDGENALYCAFSLAQAIDQVLGIELVVDLQSDLDPLPDWWRFESGVPTPPPGCRLGALGASRDFSGAPTCTDPWAGTTGDALVADYTPGSPRGGTNQARIRAVADVSVGPALALDGSHTYYGLKLILRNSGTSVCSGCASPVCLVLNSIWLRRPGVPGGDVLLTAPGPGNANWATWQASASQNCAAVPVRRRTWGALKSLYR